MQKFRFVLATNDCIGLTSKHFGDSEYFLPGEISEDGTINFQKQIKNDFMNIDESSSHGSKEKRKSIISYLGKDVDFIIAGQMSPNFNVINSKTKVSPIVSDIKKIADLTEFLKSNFELLKKIHDAKSESKIPDIMRIKKIQAP